MSDALPNACPARLSSPPVPSRRRHDPTVLELVTETVDQDLDLAELHQALAAVLVSYHRKQHARSATT